MTTATPYLVIRARDEHDGYGGSYGYEQGLYEAAVIFNNRLCYDTPVTDDVIGYLDEEGVSEIMRQIHELPAKPKVVGIPYLSL